MSRPSFDQWTQRLQLLPALMKAETEYVKDQIENQILDIKRQGKEVGLAELKALQRQNEKELQRAKREELLSRQAIEREQKWEAASLRLLRGQVLHEPADEFRGLMHFVELAIDYGYADKIYAIAFDASDWSVDQFLDCGHPIADRRESAANPTNAFDFIGWLSDTRRVPKLGSYGHRLLCTIFTTLNEIGEQVVTKMTAKMEAIRKGEYVEWRKNAQQVIDDAGK